MDAGGETKKIRLQLFKSGPPITQSVLASLKARTRPPRRVRAPAGTAPRQRRGAEGGSDGRGACQLAGAASHANAAGGLFFILNPLHCVLLLFLRSCATGCKALSRPRGRLCAPFPRQSPRQRSAGRNSARAGGCARAGAPAAAAGRKKAETRRRKPPAAAVRQAVACHGRRWGPTTAL